MPGVWDISKNRLQILGLDFPRRKKVNLSRVFAGQDIGVKEIDDGIWLVTFMDYDLGFFDLETNKLEPLDYPFAPEIV